jgi:DNA-binding response OmpR family regulator
MLSTTQNLQAAVPASANNSILLVSQYAEDHTILKTLLHASGWSITRCSGATDSIRQIALLKPALIICERDLLDGNWRTVLAACEASSTAPLVLVVSRHADENLWAEVLNLGGYDVLLKPFDKVELSRVIGMAWRQWQSRSQVEPANSGPSKQRPAIAVSVQYN